MSEKVFQDYLKSREDLVESRLNLTKKLLQERYFFKYFEVYFNGERIVLSRVSEDIDYWKYSTWVGPVISVNPFVSSDVFVENLLHSLNSIEKNNESWKLNLKI